MSKRAVPRPRSRFGETPPPRTRTETAGALSPRGSARRRLPCSPLCLLRLAQEPGERLQRIDTARTRPRGELGHVHPAIGDLAVVNPTLRLVQSIAQLPLGQPGTLAECAEERRQPLAGRGVLGLGPHP